MPTVRKDQETWGLEADRPATARRCCESGKKVMKALESDGRQSQLK